MTTRRGPDPAATTAPTTATTTPTRRRIEAPPLALRVEQRLAQEASRLRGRPLADRVAYALSQAANHSVLWHAVNLGDLIIAVASGDTIRRRRAVRRSVVQAAEQAIINGPVKAVVRRSRPPALDEHPHRLRQPVTTSFPSGHATAGACAAEMLGADLGHRCAWWLLAGAVGWSRLHVGVHHPGDVLAGWAIGGVSARIAQRLWPTPGSGPRSGR